MPLKLGTIYYDILYCPTVTDGEDESELWASYGVSNVGMLDRFERVITTPQYIHIYIISYVHSW